MSLWKQGVYLKQLLFKTFLPKFMALGDGSFSEVPYTLIFHLTYMLHCS